MARGTRVVRPAGVILKDSICSVDECGLNCYKGSWDEQNRALCKLHASRWLRTGDPTGVKSTRGRCHGLDREEDLDKRFITSLEIGDRSEDGYTRHLLFTGYTSKGYGRISIGKKGILAHRYSYEKWVGPIPEGHDLDHRPECPKNCVNPAHLTPRTRSEHIRITASRGEWPEDIHKRAWETRRLRYGASGRRGGV